MQWKELTVIHTSSAKSTATLVGMKVAARRNSTAALGRERRALLAVQVCFDTMMQSYRDAWPKGRHITKHLLQFSIESMENKPQFDIINNNFDEIDWIMIKLTQSNARISFAELGRRAGLSPPAAAERLRRLEDLGVIRGYRAKISPPHLGLGMLAIIEMRVSRAEYQRFQKATQKIPWVLECHHVAGRASFFLKAAVPDSAGLELLIGHLSQFGETNTSVVLSTVLDDRQFCQDRVE
jgi:Lrp/AsnC family transcriptional regulator, leucine-responsive regulatory protein